MSNKCDRAIGLCACGQWHILPAGAYVSEEDKLRAEVKELEARVKFWNHAWHEAREKIGKAYWEIPWPVQGRVLDAEERRRLERILALSEEESC